MKVLVAADGSSHSHEAVALLQRLKLPAGSEIVLLNVLEDFEVFTYGALTPAQLHDQLRERRRSEAAALLDDIRNSFESERCTLRTEIREGNVADEIIRLAECEKSQLIVVGSRGLSALDRFLLGSTSYRVLKHAPCSVLMSCPGPTAQEPAARPADDRLRIQLCWDGSPACEEALATLSRLPLGPIADLRVVSVLSLVKSFRMDILQTMSDAWRSERQLATEATEKAAVHLRAAAYSSVMPLVREADDVTDDLLNTAGRWPADIIMVGSSGKSAIDRFLLGSVSARIAHHAPCAVWLVRPPQ